MPDKEQIIPEELKTVEQQINEEIGSDGSTPTGKEPHHTIKDGSLQDFKVKPKPIEMPAWFIEQVNPYDSGICAVAMAARKTYGQIANFIPRNITKKFKDVPTERIIVTSVEMTRILFELNVNSRLCVMLDLFENWESEKWRSDHSNAIYEYTREELKDYIIHGGKVILGVANRQNQKFMHWIYVESFVDVFDPCPDSKLRHKNLNEVTFAEAILVGGLPSGEE